MQLRVQDKRQLKALTGVSPAQFDHLLPVFSETDQAQQQKTYKE